VTSVGLTYDTTRGRELSGEMTRQDTPDDMAPF